MSIQFIYILFFLICSVQSDVLRKQSNFKISYCTNKNKVCIPKCCDEGKILKYLWKEKNSICMDPSEGKKTKDLKLDYPSLMEVGVMKGDKVIPSSKKFEDLFEFTTEYNYPDKNKVAIFRNSDYVDLYISEDGTILINASHEWVTREVPDYCVDIRVFSRKRIITTELFLQLATLQHRENVIYSFLSIGTMITCFFMLLVLLVYCLLRELRNLLGYCLMAYIVTFITCMMLKETQYIIKLYGWEYNCKVLLPITYYFILACFTWSNILTVQAWSIATSELKVMLTRRSWKKKFWKYSLYAWLIPLVGVGLAEGLDHTPSFPDQYKQNFAECSNSDVPQYIWVITPAVLLTLINLIFFIKTVRYVYETNRRIEKVAGSGNSNRIKMSLGHYIKFSVAMGVSWLLEAVPSEGIPSWLFILVNFYNVFIGVAMFITFICKKKIYRLLCKRFNISAGFTERLHSRYTSFKNSFTRSSRLSNAMASRKSDLQVTSPQTPRGYIAVNLTDQAAKLEKVLEENPIEKNGLMEPEFSHKDLP